MFTPSVIFALTFLFSKDFVKFYVSLLEVSLLCDVYTKFEIARITAILWSYIYPIAILLHGRFTWLQFVSKRWIKNYLFVENVTCELHSSYNIELNIVCLCGYWNSARLNFHRTSFARLRKLIILHFIVQTDSTRRHATFKDLRLTLSYKQIFLNHEIVNVCMWEIDCFFLHSFPLFYLFIITCNRHINR